MNRNARLAIRTSVWAAAAVVAILAGAPSWAVAQEAEEGEEAEAQKDSAEEEGDESEKRERTPMLFSMEVIAVGDDISDIISERIGQGLRSRLDGSSDIDLLPTLEGMGQTGKGADAVAEAKRLYTSGIGLVKAGDGEEAVDILQEAVDILEDNLVYLEEFDVLVDAYKNLAHAYHIAGYDYDAQKAMKVYSHLDPNAELDPEDYPEELIDIHGAEAKKVEKAGPGELKIEADKEGATVIVDGEKKGETPLTVDDVGYGYHYLVAHDSTGKYWTDQIRVRGRGKSQDLMLELASAEEHQEKDSDERPAYYSSIYDSVQSGSFGDDLDTYLAELHKETNADFVGWTALTKTDDSYRAHPFVYRTSDQTLFELEPVDFKLNMSDLQLRIRDLGDRFVESLQEAPKDRATDSVELDVEDEDEPSVAAREAGADVDGDEGDDAAEETDESEQADATAEESESAESVTPPPEPDEEADGDSNTWMWVGVGSSAVIVTGAIVGGSMLLSNSAGSNSFNAELTW
ncbi:MAG: PEGA domain-containing protein [Persicimonas sp.]